jgi:hypothetical protein
MRGPTLLTSPVSLGDFLLRLGFFVLAPVGIVLAAELFPVRGALIDVCLALAVFVAGEAARNVAARSRVATVFLKEALAFEGFYRAKPPRPFLYYFFYPLLFPYWLTNREARREFLMFRGYTIGSLAILLLSLAWQYHRDYLPELGMRRFLPAVAISLVVETLLVLSLLMPIATTVVWYHASFRRRRLVIVLLAGLVSTAAVTYRVSSHRDPIVSYFTRKRVAWRTSAAKKRAHAALLDGVMAAWNEMHRERATGQGVEQDGKVEGVPLDNARAKLRELYKIDESFAFDLWASPKHHPRVIVLYSEARSGRPPIWVALENGAEIQKLAELPKGALAAMKQAADTSDAIGMLWEDDDEPTNAPRSRPSGGSAGAHGRKTNAGSAGRSGLSGPGVNGAAK